jgi:chlorobactene glucosyltransferase
MGLAALTAAGIDGALYTFRALDQIEIVPSVDALLEEPTGGGEWPRVSIIVPARNEERNLPRLLPTLLRQHYPDYEVIVVDDQSEDASPRILNDWARRDTRLKVVHGKDLPRDQGWLGKPHAMHQGAERATGEWLLFTDADTTHTVLALSSAMAYALAHEVDAFSILPATELGTAIERIVMPVAFEGINLLYPANKVNDPNSKIAIANGQFILIKRDVYDAVGGTARVKDKIAEDLEFAKAIKSDGFRLRMADGRHLMSVRMYTNFQEIWEGWSKNTVLSFRENPAQGLLSVAALFSSLVLPLLLFRWARDTWRDADHTADLSDRVAASWIMGIGAWSAGVPLVYRRRVDMMLGLPPGWTLTQPLGTLIFALIMLNSVIRLALGRGVTWKGRTYAHRQER